VYKEQVTWVHHWGEKTFSFRTTRNQSFRFNAGEFAMIGLEAEGKNILRAYSVVSAPWEEELEWLSVKVQDGDLTSRLQHLKEGDEVILQPKCVGTLRNDALTDGNIVWMLATGTGLAPFMSLIRDIDTLERWDKIMLVHSVRNREELAYNHELTRKFVGTELFEILHNTLEYVPIITGEGDKRITAQLESGELAVDPKQDKIMICGNMQFNEDVMSWCDSKGMREGTLRTPGEYVFERAFVEK
jgi:ferredoxin/flavodoxin---NADP+ reductase